MNNSHLHVSTLFKSNTGGCLSADYKDVVVILNPFACSHIIAMFSQVVSVRCISWLISLYPLIVDNQISVSLDHQWSITTCSSLLSCLV